MSDEHVQVFNEIHGEFTVTSWSARIKNEIAALLPK